MGPGMKESIKKDKSMGKVPFWGELRIFIENEGTQIWPNGRKYTGD